jgi:Domain of unknown function (DUF3472)/Domain of unknown function (DUF5077)
MVAPPPGTARPEASNRRSGTSSRTTAATKAFATTHAIVRGHTRRSPPVPYIPRMRRLLAFACLFPLLPLPRAQEPTPPPTNATTLTLPAFTGYAHPLPDAMKRSDDGSVARCDGSLHFYVHLQHAGTLTIRLEHTDPSATAANPRELHTTVRATTSQTSTTHRSSTADLGTFTIAAPGFHAIALAATDGKPLRDLRALHLSGPAAVNAHANVVERRNAASVHLGYPIPKPHRDAIEWFYLELTPQTDPVWSYYMATGWHRGYFGMQVNSPTERRIIFSVWDAGGEAIDRGKVADDNRVKLVAKGDGVHAGDFGNEGTGGHSHWQHAWKLGDTFRFLMHAKAEGDATTYTGWFWLAEQKEWRLIASFRAPKDGKQLHGLYSFSENFHGANGDQLRECEFGNGWVRTTGGQWLPLHEAHFTHDETGEQARTDRCAGVRGDRFYLRHGDFTPAPDGAATTYRQPVRVPPSAGKPPSDAELPTPPARTAR